MSVGAGDDRAQTIGAQYLRPAGRERSMIAGVGSCTVPCADRHERQAWLHGVEERFAAARLDCRDVRP